MAARASAGRYRSAMEQVLELRLLAALAAGAAPAHVVAQRLDERPPETFLYGSFRRLEQRGCVQRLRGRAYRLTRRGLAHLKSELALERLLARSA